MNEFGADGTGVFAGAHQAAIQNPASIALDSNGHAWLSNDAANSGGAASYLRGMAIDSSGTLWSLADSTTGAVVQTFGFAAPSYPLLSYAQGGVIIQ